MSNNDLTRPGRYAWLMSLTLVLWTTSANAQITEVWIGVTPTCPYGISACWAGAYGALGCLEGVDSVAKTPDAYNCTARVHLEHRGLPDVELWTRQFKSAVGDVYAFRGIEITVEGWVNESGDGLVLVDRDLKTPVSLAPLQHKLQWNYKKKAARQFEPDERDAFCDLLSDRKSANATDYRVQLTGPLIVTDDGVALEVREFFPQ